MSEKNSIDTDNGFESIAARMIEKYPEGHITEIEIGWPCRSGIRATRGGIDSPVAIFTGSYQELNAFEHAYNRIRRARTSPLYVDTTPDTTPREVAYHSIKEDRIMWPAEA